MAKTVSSAGLQDFIATGRPTQVFPDKKNSVANSASPLEIKAEPSAALPPEEKPIEGQESAKPESADNELEPEDKELPERASKRIAKKHYEMKKAQEEANKAREEAEESERFAENLFNERESWKKRAEAAEAEIAKGRPAPVKEPELTKPDPKDFYNEQGQFKAMEYAEKLAEFAAKQALAEDKKKQAEEAQARAKEQADAVIKERIAKAQEKYPDWQKVVSTSSIILQNECLHFIGASDYGMDIAYFLAKNPKDAERIAKLNPYLAVAELGKLQTQFEKPANPPAPAASKTVEPKVAPAPITPISTSGTGSINVDPAKMSFKELRAYERERARKH